MVFYGRKILLESKFNTVETYKSLKKRFKIEKQKLDFEVIGFRFCVIFRSKTSSVRSTSVNLECHKRRTHKCRFRMTLKIVKNFNFGSLGFHDPSNG